MKAVFQQIHPLYILCIFIFFTSCEKKVSDDINLPEAPKRLVIEGGIERNRNDLNQVQRVRLTTTANYLSDEDVGIIEDATVQIIVGSDSINLAYDGDGYYQTSGIVPEPNTVYKIRIVWQNEIYEGSDVLKEAPPFDRFYYEFEEETIFTDEGYFIKFDITDPPGVENYYYYRVFVNGEFRIVPDPGNSFTLVESDEFFDGQQRLGINPNEEVAFEPGDVAKAQQLSISEDYYDYLHELFIQTGTEGFSFIGNPPPASIRSNVINLTEPQNRPLGFFYAADVVEDSIVIEE